MPHQCPSNDERRPKLSSFVIGGALVGHSACSRARASRAVCRVPPRVGVFLIHPLAGRPVQGKPGRALRYLCVSCVPPPPSFAPRSVLVQFFCSLPSPL